MSENNDMPYEDTVREEVYRPLLEKFARNSNAIKDAWRSANTEEKNKEFWDNVKYLAEHGLVKVNSTRAGGGHEVPISTAITARGRDFLSAHGGLTKKLNVITVEISPDSIKAILEANIDNSDKPAEEKSFLRKQIAAISDEGMKRVADGLLTFGASHIPDLASFLGSMLRGL